MLGAMEALGEGCLAIFGVFAIVAVIGILISLCQKYEIDGFQLVSIIMLCLFVIGVVLIVLVKCMTETT